MKKLKLYLDTSVLNFALAEEASLALHQKATRDLLKEIEEEKHEAFISELVLAEINKAPQAKAENLKRLLDKLPLGLLGLSETIDELANKYVEEGIIPAKYRNDALHIAIASAHDLDAIVSWNFEHKLEF